MSACSTILWWAIAILFRFLTGSVCHYTECYIRDISGVLAVFAERRQDRHGPYATQCCVTLR
ncbi:DUF987 family protein [Klebsiella aerogenes]